MEYLFIYLLQLSESVSEIQLVSIVATIISGIATLITYFAISTDNIFLIINLRKE